MHWGWIALAALTSTAQAADTLEGEGAFAGASVQIDNDFEARYYQVDEKLEGFEDRGIHDYVEQVNRLNLLVTKPDLTFSMQIDQVALFANRYILDGDLYHSTDLLGDTVTSPWTDAFVNLEKMSLKKRRGGLEVQIGDAYSAFARGIALNLARNTDIDVDTSLRGVRAVARGNGWDLTILSGLTNPQQVSQDLPNQDLKGDRHHMISGARVERGDVLGVDLGVHGLVMSFDRQDGTGFGQRYSQPLDVAIAGGSAAIFDLAGLDLYAEGALFQFSSADFFGGEEDAIEPGYATYLAASAYPGMLSILVEAKRYKNTELVNQYATLQGYEIAGGPSLEYERVITEDSAAALNSNDVWGARARVDLSLQDGSLVPYVSLAAFRDLDTGALHFNESPETIVHPVAGVEYFGETIHVVINSGVRNDIRDDDSGQDTQAHLDSSILVPAGPLGEIELAIAAERFLWGENPIQQHDFTEIEGAVTVMPTEKWALTLYQDYSDNPLVTSTGNVSENVYAAGEAQYALTSDTTVKFFYGAYKAGIRCAGGQCKSLPGFKGGRVAVVGQF
jgi:hypothetical protein